MNTPRPSIFIARAVFPEVEHQLRQPFEVETTPAGVFWNAAQLAEKLQGKAGVMTTGGERIDAAYGRPSAILVASAHWETESPEVSAPAANATIHDFRGFPSALYDIRYPAPPAPDIATATTSLLRSAGIRATIDLERGLEHGALCLRLGLL